MKKLRNFVIFKSSTMKRHYTFSTGEQIEADVKDLRRLLAQNQEYLKNYEEMFESLDEPAYVARGNGFCDTQYSEDFIDNQIVKYKSRIKDLEHWLSLPAVAKHDLRVEMRQLKKQHAAEELARQSEEVIANLEACEEFRNARTVMMYAALPDEVLTQTCIERWRDRKRIVLPTVCGDDIVPIAIDGDTRFITGDFNISEPEGEPYAGSYDLMVVPGMAFDKKGNRLGRGRGYYDRFLKKFPDVRKIGICFDFQLRETIATEPDDVAVDRVITAQ